MDVVMWAEIGSIKHSSYSASIRPEVLDLGFVRASHRRSTALRQDPLEFIILTL